MRVLLFLPFCSSWKKQEQRGWVALGCVHPTLVAQTGPSCLGCKGLAVLGTQQVPTAKMWKLHKMLCFAQDYESMVWSFWHSHLHFVAPALVCCVLHCSSFMEGIVWAEFGLCFLPQVGAEGFYSQHQHPAALCVLHPQNTFHAYCPFSSGFKPMALFHPRGSRVISNLKTEDTVGITQV